LVGRVNDPFKRGFLAIQSLVMAGFHENEVVTVGSENPNWGTYLGIVNDTLLNDLYNSVDFVMMCSSFEGLGLPGLESMAAGAIPVVCHDLTTVAEFYPPHMRNYPSPQCLSLFLRKRLDNPEILQAEHDYLMNSVFTYQFKKEQIAKNILDVYNYRP